MGFIMVPKQIVILGGGAGGLVAANELRKKLGTEHRIVVIDKNSKHVFQPSLLWLMIGQRKPEKIQKELSLLTRKGIEFINDEVKEISISEKSVKTGKGAINFDYLIISLGADLAAESIKGLKESGFNLYSIDSVSKLGKELEKFTDGKIVVLIAGTPFKCPAAPYEAAMLLDYYFKKKVGSVKSFVSLRLWSTKNIFTQNLLNYRLPILVSLLGLSFLLQQIGYFKAKKSGKK